MSRYKSIPDGTNANRTDTGVNKGIGEEKKREERGREKGEGRGGWLEETLAAATSMPRAHSKDHQGACSTKLWPRERGREGGRERK